MAQRRTPSRSRTPVAVQRDHRQHIKHKHQHLSGCHVAMTASNGGRSCRRPAVASIMLPSFASRRNLLALLSTLLILQLVQLCTGADLVIEIPGNQGLDDSFYRLDYYPPIGNPAPNATIASRDVGDEIQFSNGLPGTRYNFWLYYTNSTHKDWLTWTVSITTAPDPPANLTVIPRSGKNVIINWSPPAQGNYSSFKLKIVGLTDSFSTNYTTTNEDNQFQYMVRDLTPGATYQVQAYTLYDGKESVAYTSRNFTTKRYRHKDLLAIKILREPNTPGKFIVWFRNETTLLVLWQPPYPAGIYTHYKVSIEPPDALGSVLYVQKEGEPPGPAQAAFKGLVPGRAYNISVQTMSEDEISLPTTAQYRTVPLRPLNVTFDKKSITENSFKVMWEAPKGISEFDKYQVSLSTSRRQQAVLRNDNENMAWLEFKENLEPGKTYQVVVKTVSGKVTSWPASGDVTLKPLPVKQVTSYTDGKSGVITISWKPDELSTQDEYRISYHELETNNGDSSTMSTNATSFALETLLPGRNYSITVQALSRKMESNETVIFVVTRPSSPIIEDLKSIREGLNISWKSDVNSKQDKYEVTYTRNDTNDGKTILTTESRLVFTNLYPGAGYEVKVFAVSHGLRSEPHSYFQAVYPNPPRNMTIEKVTSNSVLVHWKPPERSEFTEYSIRYRTESEKQWIRLPSVKATEADVTDMTPGEKYTIQVNTVSFGVESPNPQQVNQTVRPNPVSNIAPLVDSNNITLEFPRPEGRVETYIINWWPTEQPEQLSMKNFTEANTILPYPGTLSDDEKIVEEPPLVRLLIGDLMSGVMYNFKIQTISYGLTSDVTKLQTRTMPLIQSEVLIVNNMHTRDMVTLSYTPTPQQSSKFDLYRFSLGDPSIPDKEKLANDTDRKVTFTGLTPGRLYNITVWTVSGKVSSQPIQRQDRMFPDPITVLEATGINDTWIALKWDIPKGEYTAFEIQYLMNDSHYVQNYTVNNHITITDLKPHRNYTFTVVVRSGTESSVLRVSLPISANFQTKEALPGRMDKFAPVDIQPSEITFEWSLPPNEQNGIIRQFTITYGLDGSQHTQVKDFRPNELRGSIKGLQPGKSYVFRIQAKTAIGYGPEHIWKQKMPILAPPKPETQVVPTEVGSSATTIEIRFRKHYFSDQNGVVTTYTIIIAEDDSKNASGLEMPSWRDVQSYSVWPPYQVIEPYYPFKNSSVEDFTIGTENCDAKKTGYCNGPLKSGTTYKVMVRAFTAPDKFTDTAYSYPIRTAPLLSVDAQDNTSLIVSITVPLLLILMLVGLVLFIRRRRHSGRKTAEQRTNDNMSLPDSTIETSRPVLVKNFAEHYRMMSADSDFRFSEEFEELKHVGRDQPCTFADLPCNRPKNRFTNILPYDHSRFKLQPVDDEEGSDYINANYVPGHNSPREFIVTQGPLHSTRDDFWRMCWESNSRAIVMLTRTFEKGREKCDHYWPHDTVPVYYGDIKVTLLNDSHYPDWVITEFMMTRGDQQRVIRHFHFTTWPDFGVPNPPQTLARFVRAFRERVGPDQRPIVVHCSAGVGRSGTFITLDRILQQIQVSDYVDIFGIVWAMRKERVWMVQTEQQYICIHQCLLVVLEGKEGTEREIHDNQGYEEPRDDQQSEEQLLIENRSEDELQLEPTEGAKVESDQTELDRRRSVISSGGPRSIESGAGELNQMPQQQQQQQRQCTNGETTEEELLDEEEEEVEVTVDGMMIVSKVQQHTVAAVMNVTADSQVQQNQQPQTTDRDATSCGLDERSIGSSGTNSNNSANSGYESSPCKRRSLIGGKEVDRRSLVFSSATTNGINGGGGVGEPGSKGDPIQQQQQHQQQQQQVQGPPATTTTQHHSGTHPTQAGTTTIGGGKLWKEER
ncbi:tyrosine-protein phosphatase 10D isoform X1 [Anopheles darlingi]|uniref:tyrosine-protein phosphatase 10D isoform X1 n=1 Tax=Anopheles darlingi TaxID=43151 RepID=UPI00210062EF|nr:tyrosine-protein phosphatase 10D isoform X1 [Anopheles darlingi]XP_049533501.1 tyrosine-protein phosphatase 10D isoform X1 [Anopheles darlingi]XP_049533503.1 tyrosine-protein phosphatase 10D isoform X1 [Anopheles darlingi]XP_049533504.1 tyrosine-protein phosphatase 10D isoform X1 [Anopheles darlingi]